MFDDLQFYPTPKELAQKAWAMFKEREFERVLEPSAGEGHLIEACPRDYYSYRRAKIDAIEIDPSRHEKLREEGVQVVGFDFLKFKSGAQYSHCIMNPPFSEGARHVLHAWDILFDGEIVAILNAETIRNPFSNERKRLAKLIEEHGEVEYVGTPFSNAERPTDVEVALVWLRKEADASVINGDWLEDLKQDVKPEHRIHYEELRELALPNSFVENIVAAFRAAVKATVESVQSEAKALHYSKMLGRTLAEYDSGGGSADDNKTSIDYVRNTFRERYQKLKDRAWAGVLRSTQVTSKTSSKVQREIESEFEKVKSLEFTVENIHGFLLGLVQNKGKIQKDMALEVFDLITKYHTDNAHFYRGWVSNNKHRTAGMRIKTTRFILPGFQLESWSSSIGFRAMQTLSDIDKVFAMIDGKNEPETSLNWVFQFKLDELRYGARLSSSYFDVRLYPGIGTIHFFPRSKELVDRLNRFVGKIRKWLPPEESMASEAYWKHYAEAEKFDKALHAKVNLFAGSRGWDHPMHAIHSNEESTRTDAFQEIGAAMDAVLEDHGIDVDAMLAPATDQLLLEAA